MISSKWIAVLVQGILVFLTTQPQLFTADYLIRTKNWSLKISTLLSPAFAVRRGPEQSDYKGFIPELLEEIKYRNGTNSYELVPATGNEIGRKRADGNWTGLIQDVLTKVVDIGAGPILNTPEHASVVALSKPWASVHLTLVLKRSATVTSLKDALNNWFDFYVVNGSAEALELHRVSQQQGASDISTLQLRVKHVESVHEGLGLASRDEKSALVLNSEEARYHVTHDYCHLATVKNFQPLGNYTFAFPRGSLHLDLFNDVLVKMKQDGSLDKLKDKTLGVLGICSSAVFLRPGTVVAFLLAALTYQFSS